MTLGFGWNFGLVLKGSTLKIEDKQVATGLLWPGLDLASRQMKQERNRIRNATRFWRRRWLILQRVGCWLGLGVFRGDHGEGPFLFGWESIRRLLYIYICKLYMYNIFVFQNVIIDS